MKKAKLKRRIRVLIVSSLILMLICIYYMQTIEEDTSYQDVEESSDIILETSETNIEVSENDINSDIDINTLEHVLEEEKLILGEAIQEQLNNGNDTTEQEVIEEDYIEPVIEEVYTEPITEEIYLEPVQETIIEIEFDETKFQRDSYYGIVQIVGDVDPEYVDVVEKVLITLPPVLIESFLNEGWNIYVTAEDIATNYQYTPGSVLGITDYGRECIYIQDNYDAVCSAVEHEMGHYLDYIANVPSLGETFNLIYQEEVEWFKSYIPNPHCVTGPQEFFAEIFAWIIIDESMCTPKAEEFVKTVLNEFIYSNSEDSYY